MPRLVVRSRRVYLALVSLLGVVSAAVLLLRYWSWRDLGHATTAQLAVVLGLFVLPWATIAVRRLDRRTRSTPGPEASNP